jgi:LysR family transcriptional regulator for metE and metH
MASGEAASLRLSTECYTCYHWLPPVLKAFSVEYPGVRVTIVADATRQPVPALLAGRLDVAVVGSPETDPRLHYEHLFRDELVVIVSPDHRLATRRLVRPEDFADEHLIVYTMPDEENSLLRDVLAPAGVTPREISRIQLTEAIVEMVRAGLGISVLAKWAVRPYLESGDLAAVRLTQRGCRREWRAAMAPTASALPHVRALVRAIRENREM